MHNVVIKNSTIIDLTISESNQLKGISLLLLLCHHLFYIQNGLYADIVIHNHGVVQEFAMICKVCVALFVFLSGYGLTKKYGSEAMNIRRFYAERFVKLMPSFWLIWLLFVPIGMLFFGRTFHSVYGNDYIPQLIIQILGLQSFFGICGLNPTWWFISCIITLYLLYPLLLSITKTKHRWLLLGGGSFLLLLSPITDYSFITLYLFPFVLGIRCARGAVIPPQFQKASILTCIIILTSIWREFGFRLTGMCVDPFLAFEIILLFKSLNIIPSKIMTSLTFIGHHSMNIFMFHTFIYYYYFEDFIYSTRNPIFIFITLLSVCLVISMGIEYLKKKLHFSQYQQKIINKLT